MEPGQSLIETTRRKRVIALRALLHDLDLPFKNIALHQFELTDPSIGNKCVEYQPLQQIHPVEELSKQK